MSHGKPGTHTIAASCGWRTEARRDRSARVDGQQRGGTHPRVLRAGVPGSEVITEIYVPRADLAASMRAAADLLRPADPPVVTCGLP